MPYPGRTQDHVGQCFEQHDLVKDVPVHGRNDLGRCLPIQNNLCDSKMEESVRKDKRALTKQRET